MPTGLLRGDTEDWFYSFYPNMRPGAVTPRPVGSLGNDVINMSPSGGSVAAFDPGIIGGKVAEYENIVTGAAPSMPVISSNLAGRYAPDTEAFLARQAAERGIGIGSYGAPNTESNLLFTAQQTREGLRNLGTQQYNDLLRAIPQVNPQGLYVSAGDAAANANRWAIAQAEINARNQQLQQERAFRERMANIAAQAAAQNNRGGGVSYYGLGTTPRGVNPWTGQTESAVDRIINSLNPRGGPATASYGGMPNATTSMPGQGFATSPGGTSGGTGGWYSGSNISNADLGTALLETATSPAYDWTQDRNFTPSMMEDYYFGGTGDELYDYWMGQ